MNAPAPPLNFDLETERLRRDVEEAIERVKQPHLKHHPSVRADLVWILRRRVELLSRRLDLLERRTSP